jgi:hypothetical protein
MPGTLWSAPSSQQNDASLTTSSFVTGTLTDISPAACVIPAGTLISGTRIRLYAAGNYTATTTASALKWGFYLSSSTVTISATTSAILAETASTAAVVATAWPFQMYYSGVVNEASISQNQTTGKITGQGWSMLPTSLTAMTAPTVMPLTAAARTVTQTATITGLNTLTTLVAQIGLTVATNTGFSNVVVDELTCELLG